MNSSSTNSGGGVMSSGGVGGGNSTPTTGGDSAPVGGYATTTTSLSRVVKTYVNLTQQGMGDINGGMPRIIVGLHGLFMMFVGLRSEEIIQSLDDITLEDSLKFIVRLATMNTSGSPKAPPRALNNLFKNINLSKQPSRDREAVMAEDGEDSHDDEAGGGGGGLPPPRSSSSPSPPPRRSSKRSSHASSASSIGSRIDQLMSSFDSNSLRQVLGGIEPQNRLSTIQAAAKAVYDIMESKLQGSKFDSLSNKHRLAITHHRSRKSLNRHVHR